MANIRILPASIAERIAAGEVIERPASVVKELVENSLDAGATEICVNLLDGGKARIEVIDNGTGMSQEDLALSVKRHATSKLQTISDLEKLLTLGFRGEALPSIAAVTELTIVTRPKSDQQNDPTAFELSYPHVFPKPVTFGHFIGSPHGTKIAALGLFSQIPARLKFMKSQSAEVSQTREWLERLAISHSNVGIRLTSDDRVVLNLRPQNQLDRVRAILSEGDDIPIISEEIKNNLGTFRLYWVQGFSSAQARKLVQVVNKRAVKDKVLQQALLMPFRQALMPGQFPALALFADIDPSTIDVNVHPAKTEVRFLDSGKIFSSVETLCSSLISKAGAAAFVSGLSDRITTSYGPNSVWRLEDPAGFAKPTTNVYQKPQQQRFTLESVHDFKAQNYVGALFSAYLLYDFGDEVALIDQHAAHERIKYERIKTRYLKHGPSESQQLLLPEAIHFQPDEKHKIEKSLSLFAQLGFEVELFGEESLLVRAIPAEWGTGDLRIRLKNLVDKLLGFSDDELTKATDELDEQTFEKLASEACHSAVKAGDKLDHFQATTLVDDLFRCSHPWNCPHGRPTVVRIPKARFEEWFKRTL